MTPRFGAPVFIPAHDTSCLADLHLRKQVMIRLCAALQEYLCLDIEWQLAQAARTPPPLKPTMEQLDQAQRQREQAQAAIDALKGMCVELPKSSGDFMLASQMPILEASLQNAEEWLSRIQQAMESDVRRGTFSTLCVACERQFPDVFPAILELKAALLESGWRRSSDGDWQCPECHAKYAAAIQENPSSQQKEDI